MSGLCLLASGLLIGLGWSDFTLAWTHTIEKLRWEEDYKLRGAEIWLREARVQGSGVGMEPAPDARRVGDFWAYRPSSPPLAELRLARQRGLEDWQLCHRGQCRPLTDLLGASHGTVDLVILRPCEGLAKDRP